MHELRNQNKTTIVFCARSRTKKETENTQQRTLSSFITTLPFARSVTSPCFVLIYRQIPINFDIILVFRCSAVPGFSACVFQ